ncbi:DivIVA domain-containing protein [Actinoplanes sp. NPDC026670]|uniref:DivIVA domain-containing protein n=1 Tax=Actinoplanes sp. NPDC026670 TaxID=3154700 RepID=UPI0033D24ED4
MNPDFTIVLRGYHRTQVDAVLGQAIASLEAVGDRVQQAVAREALRTAEFDMALRGYDRDQVDRHVQRLLTALAEAPPDLFREALGAVLRLSDPTDEAIVDEVRRLRAVADRHGG